MPPITEFTAVKKINVKNFNDMYNICRWAAFYQLIQATTLLIIARANGRTALLAKLGSALGIALFSASIILRHMAGVPEIGASRRSAGSA